FKIVKLLDKTEGHTADLQNDYQRISDLFLAQKKEKTLKKWIADKQAETYIRIDDTYANCNFEFNNWMK
ncbi:MAG TPA: hypothetical protein VJ919_17125, partial [Tangfeifania sp.]|nr:hypothetical protein [Tangfeifania sp.]